MSSSRSFFEVVKSGLSIDTDTVAFKVYFFVVYGGLSGITNFSALYYKQLGLSPLEIGWVSGIRNISSIVSLPFIGLVYFKENRAHRKIFLTIFIILFICFITPIGFIQQPELCCSQNETLNVSVTYRYPDPPCCSETKEKYCCRFASKCGKPQFGYINRDLFRVFIIICILSGLEEACWMVIRNTSDVSLTQALGEHSDRYGTTKMFGSIGMALFALMAGYLIHRSSIEVRRCGTEFQQSNYSYIFIANAVFMALSAIIVLFFLKFKDNVQNTSRRNWIPSLPRYSYIKLCVISFLIGSLQTPSLIEFAYIYVSEVGGSHVLIGAAGSVGAVSGIVAGFSSSCLIRQFEHKLIYAMILITTCVMMMYSLLEINWLIIIANLLIGGGVIEWHVCVFIMRKIVVDRLTGTIYSIMTLALKIGDSVSSVLAGYLYSAYGPTWLFRIFAIFSLLAIVIAHLSLRSLSDGKNEDDNETEAKTDAEPEETSLLTGTRRVTGLIQ